ncbi:ABC transporter permease [Leadbetterella sp. DM7]|uniref:ABC transporter permease n=1 Tax=Leadbetterella sp. DM7 TaxID=3235085 RepID=UPI00349EF184
MIVRIEYAAESLGLLQSVYAKYSPDYPFEYTFTDESFRKKLVDEKVLGIISASFTVLTIFISCLGLFGLAAFSAVQRTKEIGIRKILGASVGRIIYLLSIDFLKLVIIAFLVAFPVSWWLMNDWLEHFFYKVSIEWWIFPAAGLSAILIALITISTQAIKAAIANPVKSLRTE